MNDNVLRCLTINEGGSHGLARRLALITGRLIVPSSLTLNGLEAKREIVRRKKTKKDILLIFRC